MDPLKVLFASSEVEPFMKTGGLADVAGSLPRALKKNGVDIRVVMPKFAQIPARFVERMTFLGHVEVDLVWRRQYCGVFHLQENGVDCYFLDNEYYFFRDWVYGQADDGERFAFFSKAILAFLPMIGFQPDILHLNDWQTGMTPVFLDAHYRWYRNDGFFRNMRTVFTIHNLRYQGVFPKEMMDSVLGLDWSWFHTGGVAHRDCVNFMKGALNQSTRITTVSRTYAEEIRSPFFGEGLEGTILHRGADLRGIVNGIDYEQNNPETDARLYATFSAPDLSGKAVNKASLQQQHHLPVRADVPLVGIISRLVDQKGFDLVAHVLEELLREDVQLIILGTGDKQYEDLFRWAHHTYPRKVSSHIRYDGVLAQRIYAACDMFLMPSLFEPCGLSQIFSMRYGTVPVVRETGGLKDTVIPYNAITGEGTGFSFANYNADEMLDALKRAFAVFSEPEAWGKLVTTCMRQDFSWNHAAREYETLYREMMEAYPDMPASPPENMKSDAGAPSKAPKAGTRRKAAKAEPETASVKGDAKKSAKTEPKAASVKAGAKKSTKADPETTSAKAGVKKSAKTEPKAASAKAARTKPVKPAADTEPVTAGAKKKVSKAAVNASSAAKPSTTRRKTSGSGVKGTAMRNRKKATHEMLDREQTLEILTDLHGEPEDI